MKAKSAAKASEDLPILPKPIDRRLLVSGVIILVLALAVAGYSFYQYQKTQSLLLNPTKAAEQEVTSLVSQVGKLIMLPAKEIPTVATVSDISKLKTQPFFINAQNKDKVLIYTKAKKAILYRPSTKQIVEVAPINLDDSNKGNVAGVQTNQPAPTTVPIKVVIYNGTNTVGKAKTMETELKQKVAKGIQIIDTDNAQKKDYKKTLVIDLKGTLTKEVSQLSQAIGGESSILPEGEKKPNADILIIVGE